MDRRGGAVLLVANYSNHTGYAWNNIYRLFDVIGEHFYEHGCDVYISFASLVPPVTNFPKSPHSSFLEYDPEDRSFTNTVKLLSLVRRHGIRYIYYTDQPSFDYRYAWLRLFAGVKKIVVHSRVSVPDPYPAKYERGLKGAIKALLGRCSLICPSRIYAVSDFVRDRLVKKNRLPEHRVVKILNGINIERFRPSIMGSGIGDGHTIRIFVGGRATRYKGIHILIQAAAAIKSKTELDFEIRYAGDGPDIQYLRELVDSTGLQARFTFLGELPSTDEEVAAADIVVVPSIWGDACPSAVSEALASGVPLITTSVGGVPEIVGDQENALMVSPNSVDELGAALLALISSEKLRNRIGRKGRARAEEALAEPGYHKKVIKQLQHDFELP